MEKKEEFLIEIRDALARGYCTKENEKKVLDFDLIYAMGNEIEVLISQELDKAREGQFTQQELKRIEELLGFMLSDYPSSFWKPEDKSIEKKLSKLKDNK